MCQEYPKHEIYIASDYQISCSVLAWFCRLMEATAHRRDFSPANLVVSYVYTTVEDAIGMTKMWVQFERFTTSTIA